MTRKFDWVRLKNLFVDGSWLTISSFLIDQNIQNNSYVRSKTLGWLESRRIRQEELATKIRERNFESELQVRHRQQQFSLRLQMKGLQGLKESKVDNPEIARKMVATGLEQERAALGLDRQMDSSLTQVNVNLPKTKFDKFLEDGSYEDIVQLIAMLKKLGVGAKGDKLKARQ